MNLTEEHTMKTRKKVPEFPRVSPSLHKSKKIFVIVLL